MDFEIHKSLLHMINCVSRSGETCFEAETGTPRLTFRQFIVLHAIASKAGSNMGDISERAMIDRTTLTKVTETLAERGYISKRRTRTDVRNFELHIRPDGKDVLDKMTPKLLELERSLAAAVPAIPKDTLVGAMAAMYQAALAMK